jgi:hypothetical protein
MVKELPALISTAGLMFSALAGKLRVILIAPLSGLMEEAGKLAWRGEVLVLPGLTGANNFTALLKQGLIDSLSIPSSGCPIAPFKADHLRSTTKSSKPRMTTRTADTSNLR